MKAEVQQIAEALNAAEVNYLVAGGLAVVAHGYVRVTMDVDLILDFDESNLRRGLNALQDLGFIPRPPITIEQFIDPELRRGFVEEKGMMVFSMWRPGAGNDVVVDVFCSPPFDFAREHVTAKWMELDNGCKIPFVSLECLLAMKRKAGRQKDLADIEVLEKKSNGNS